MREGRPQLGAQFEELAQSFRDSYAQEVVANREAFRRKNLPPWYGEIWTASKTRLIAARLHYPNEIPDNLIIPREATSAFSRQVVENLSSLTQVIFENPGVPQLVQQKFDLEIKIAQQLKHSHNYQEFTNLCKLADGIRASNGTSPLTTHLLGNDIIDLYLLLGSEDKFLIGTKQGEFWKRITLSKDWNQRTYETGHLAAHYLATLGLVGKKEAPLVPDHLVNSADVAEHIRLPQPARSVEDLLEDAYFNTKYVVPAEGAEVRFRKAGDLQKLIIVQSGNTLFSRFSTSMGEAVVTLDLDNASWFSPDKLIANAPDESRWNNILAEVYHDLVTAVEISTNSYRKLRGAQVERELKVNEEVILELDQPEVIYIPRKRKSGVIELREPYSGPPRPLRPHKVSGYLRRGNMTNDQRENLLKFEEDFGISILKFVPAGHTFVRPYITPSDAAAGMIQLPIFIKRRIEERLQGNLQRQVN